jgi:metal-responsive CopG/Arc/MetJ family transcriptional regulator
LCPFVEGRQKIILYVRKYLQDQAKQDRNFISKVSLFQKMKTQLKGQRREDITEIQAEKQALLNSDTKRHFERCLQQ